MATIKEVLARNIEENIAPVIYFHQIDPQTAAQEVREYVFTSRPDRDNYQGGGIHEQMVRLLQEIAIAVHEGRKLPASWISGFFGSGKSSFAKLLGLALDGMVLPDGTTMDQALLSRNDTPQASELRFAWDGLKQLVQSKAVVFDIGTAAKNNESIPHTVYRQVLERLGYSSHDGVAYFEIALEDEGRMDEFRKAYKELNGKEWDEQKNSGLAPQKFRPVYKQLFPEQDNLMETSTFDIHRLPIKKLVENLLRVMERRAPGATIFVVVDEVSQYINKDHNKMLDLQSFVSEIGGKAQPGRVPLWLLVTGQEKLEEESSESVLFKLKDRFPESLRVHLDRSNVREVVERRLLKKKPASQLESYLTDGHLDRLRLYGFEAAAMTREQFIAHYPLLPSHIPLFMDITQSIRNTSARTQSDAGGVRSVLNNIWDLFNRPPVVLKDKPLGTLLTLDMLYDIIGSSIDSDVRLTLDKLFDQYPAESWEVKVVKSIALLEMNGEQRPVTGELLASLLYPSLGAQPVLDQVKAALETLRAGNWIQVHEKSGWSIQNNAAQDWNRQKNEMSVSNSELVEQLRPALVQILENVAQPVFHKARFPLVAYWGEEDRITTRNELTHAPVCFHWINNESRRENQGEWLALSRTDKHRFHWVSGDTGNVELLVREYCRSTKMVSRYRSQGQLQMMQNQLLHREMAESERLFSEIRKEMRAVWLDGRFYFNGAVADPRQEGNGFDGALKGLIETRLEQLYHKFRQGHVDVKDGDFRQLLERDVSGLATVFFDREDGLGIAVQDGSRTGFETKGPVPKTLLEAIENQGYIPGEKLVATFAGPPYGYSRLVIKSAVVGLLRDEKILLRDGQGNEISSILDPGAKNVFESDREFARAEIERRQEDQELSSRDRVDIRLFFEQTLGLSQVDSNSDGLADLVFKNFVRLLESLKELQQKLQSMDLKLPKELVDFNKVLLECLADRHVDKALRRVKQNLVALRDGYPRLKELQESFTSSTEEALRSLQDVLTILAVQLKEVSEQSPVQDAIDELEGHLTGPNPWRGYSDVNQAAQQIVRHYESVRALYLENQREALDKGLEELKRREEFTGLDGDQQFMVMKKLRDLVYDSTPQAVSPTLLLLNQVPPRIAEALGRAHKLIDQLVNETLVAGEPASPEKPGPIYPVKLNLRNRVVTSEAELDQQLGRIREKCIRHLQNNERVRFEE